MAKRNRKDVTFDENEQVEVTEEKLEEGKAKAKKKKTPSRKSILRKEIFEAVLLNVDDMLPKIRDKIVEYQAIPSKGRGPGAGAASTAARVKTMILEEKKVHEDIFYNKFKMGRLECKRKFYNMRTKLTKAEDAVYVSFNSETGVYELEGTGATPPKGFDAPKVKEA